MALRIPLSFKEKEKDLYDFVMSKKSPSAYIKELIDADRQKKDMPKERPRILDF
jgi:hypothetical protein